MGRRTKRKTGFLCQEVTVLSERKKELPQITCSAHDGSIPLSLLILTQFVATELRTDYFR